VGHIVELPRPDATVGAEANAINEQGEIVGTLGFLTGSRAVRWDPETYAPSYLPQHSVATIRVSAINSGGAVVGTYDAKPVVWHSTSSPPVFLPTGTWGAGKANAINDAGVIVGQVSLDPNHPEAGAGGVLSGKAALWTIDEELVDLQPDVDVQPSVASEAVAINTRGAVVGNTNITPANPGGRATRFR
jgi:uncharacterized membrane protein